MCLRAGFGVNTQTSWMDAFYGSPRRQIDFYSAQLLPAGQLSCYCQCYISGTNGSDRSVLTKPRACECKGVYVAFV